MPLVLLPTGVCPELASCVASRRSCSTRRTYKHQYQPKTPRAPVLHLLSHSLSHAHTARHLVPEEADHCLHGSSLLLWKLHLSPPGNHVVQHLKVNCALCHVLLICSTHSIQCTLAPQLPTNQSARSSSQPLTSSRILCTVPSNCSLRPRQAFSLSLPLVNSS